MGGEHRHGGDAGRGHVAAGHGEVGGEVPRQPDELPGGGEGADGTGRRR